jgi:hypothetical protein
MSGGKLQSKDTHHIDLYKILEVTIEATDQEIEDAYDKMCHIYHPDNIKSRQREQIQNVIEKHKAKGKKISKRVMDQLEEKLNDKLKDAVMTFNLINQAYSKLSKDRAAYDAEYAKFQELDCDFTKMKDSAANFMKSQKDKASEEDILKKKQIWDEMNRKHGFREDQTKREVAAMKENETNKLLEEMKAQRLQFDQQDKPELILDPKNLDRRKFNALFEKTYKKQNKGELMDASGPMPMGLGHFDQYCGLNQFDQVYAEDDNNLDELSFSAADFTKGKNKNKITQEDIDNLEEDDYVKYDENENKITEDDINKYQADRDLFKTQREAWTMKDYSTDVMYGGVYEGLESSQSFEALEFADSKTKDHYRKFLTTRANALQKKANKNNNLNNQFYKQMDQESLVPKRNVEERAYVDPRDFAQPRELMQHGFGEQHGFVQPEDIMYGRAVNTRGGAQRDNRDFNRSMDDLMKARAEDDKNFKNLYG